MNTARPPHLLLLLWLTLAGLVVFGSWVCLDQGLVQAMVAADRSRICIVLIVMYLAGVAHTFARTWYLSHEIERADQLSSRLQATTAGPLTVRDARLCLSDGTALAHGFVADYLVDMRSDMPAPHERSELLDAYASRIRGAHEFGWFYIDAMLKVGFLGTLVGFILMLSSVADTTTLDAGTMQKVLQQMSVGMSTALYTTLASLVGGILLSIPYYLLDRGLEALLQTTIRIREVVIPSRASVPV